MPNDMTPPMRATPFTLANFFEGETRAWGIFEDRFGRVRLRFTVVMHGAWTGDTFTLNERFAYDDGRSEQRTWTVWALADGRFRATCADCIGQASGKTTDDQITMSYVLRLQLRSRTLHVRFDDRLIRIDERRVVNRATMSKWGIRLGELSLFFERDRVARAA